MEMLSGVAREKGVSDEELGTVQAVVMLVSAGRVFSQYQEVCARMESNTEGKPCCAK